MAMTPEQAVDRARTLGVLTQQIEEIRGKVGSYHLTQQLTSECSLFNTCSIQNFKANCPKINHVSFFPP
jgi:hypothetical protein